MTNFRPTTLSPEALKIWDEAEANIQASLQRIRELSTPVRRPADPDFRALCAELCHVWSRATNPDDLCDNLPPLITRIRAALEALPE